MMYEIKIYRKDNINGGREYKKSYLATEITFGKRDKLDAVGFKKEGKNNFTWEWIEVTPYMKNKYEFVGEVIITEATTGRRMYVFNY